MRKPKPRPGYTSPMGNRMTFMIGVALTVLGDDGRGGRVGMMFCAVEIPDIRYSVLTSARSQDGTSVPAWSDSDIARAIRDGLEPNGQSVSAPMPRWDMTDVQLSEVIGYLKELGKR